MSVDPERDAVLSRLEASLGHRFAQRELLEQALCHASFSHAERAHADKAHAQGSQAEGDAIEHNERLEFLGDAVLGMVVAEALYHAKPDWREGALTRARHAIVAGRSLARAALTLGVGEALRLGPTEQASGGAEKPSILENALEAIVGAIYLDAGLPAVADFVSRVFGEAVASNARPVARDPKTALQERLMAEVGAFPTYRLVRDSEAEGDDERFTVEVVSQERALASGRGRTKRQAERRAARRALASLDTASASASDAAPASAPDEAGASAERATAKTGGA